MGAILPLPAELTAYLRRELPQALLVRGPPGAGKTTLAFALLQSFPGNRIYVSGRVRRSDLVQDFPWIASHSDQNVTVVDWADPDQEVGDTLRAMLRAPQVLRGPEARRQLRSLLLPPEVLEAWSQSSPVHPTMIALDSWDAIVEKHLGIAAAEGLPVPPRAELERIALTQLMSGPVFVVIVVEDRVAGQLEYLANGVVTLGRTTTNDRLERWVEIDKLRGVRIASPSYPFTLEGGRFQCASRLEPRTELKLGPMDPEPDHIPGAIWPGSTDFAAHFRRPRIGRLTLIEKDPDVPDHAVRLLIAPLLTNVLRNKGRVFHVLPPRFHPLDVWKMCDGLLTPIEFQRQVRMETTYPLDSDDELTPVLVPFREGGASSPEPRTPEALRWLADNHDPDRPNLSVLWSSGFRALNALAPDSYTPDNLPAIAQAYLRKAVLHEVFIGYTGDPLTEALAPMAEVRLHMTLRTGRVFVYGIDPATPYLVLSEGMDRSPYRLLLVV